MRESAQMVLSLLLASILYDCISVILRRDVTTDTTLVYSFIDFNKRTHTHTLLSYFDFLNIPVNESRILTDQRPAVPAIVAYGKLKAMRPIASTFYTVGLYSAHAHTERISPTKAT